ncbi:MAG: polyphosphate kinase [Bacteroidota bacterium]|nr:polyphosphate kinase [Bacteroidota bacterium]MDP4217861.1 polyphosphate kinase [Bacteroidota bacterium]MDP4254543.1 polyphosphate kinase [Bacteroidota bacterium]
MGKIRLKEIDTRAPSEFDKKETKEKLDKILLELDELQNLLYAESGHSMLVVIQGMDASGKDGTIRNVFGKLNPQGVQVKSFKEPTAEELSHDFLWRIHEHAPGKGLIQIFNRSHYEDILVTRVHNLIDDKTAARRMKAINDFERLLTEHNSTGILKFYLHISPQEQHDRLEERVRNPAKQYKYNANDFKEAKLWDDYMKVYEDCFEFCDRVPWTIVPSDQNWYKEWVIAKAVRDALKGFDMQYPGIKK